MKKTILLLMFCICIVDDTLGQTRSLNGVYAGVELVISPLIGGGMNRNDIVILFRPDGTLNDQMDKPDWKTRVTGKYQLSGKKVLITFTKGRKDSYTIKDDDQLDGGPYYLFKLDGGAVPVGYYEYTYASGSGGGVSGMAYVGNSTQRGLNFDGKGNFSNSRSSATVIAGDNIGGGGSSKGSGHGTYKIDKGVLTLTYSNGKTELHSFFCRPHDQDNMAAIDGDLYFIKNDKDKSAKSSSDKTRTDNSISKTSADDKADPAATDGQAILLKANEAHGGAKLDKLNTIRFSATIMGVKAVELIDIGNNKMRFELWKNGRLSAVEQMEGNGGWQWANGKRNDLSPARITEMKSGFYSGILGLRKAALNQMQVVGTRKLKNQYSILCRMDGNDYVFAINDQYQLAGEGNKAGGKTSISVLSDLRPVQGIMIPFHEVQSSGSQKLIIQYDKFEINPSFNNSDWAVPQGS